MLMIRKRVLVAASERHIARLMQVILERQGYEVELAFNSDSFWEKAMALSPDLIVLDMGMPDAEQLRARWFWLLLN